MPVGVLLQIDLQSREFTSFQGGFPLDFFVFESVISLDFFIFRQIICLDYFIFCIFAAKRSGNVLQ